MAWMASNLYIHSSDLSRVVAAVKDLMARPEQRPDREGILGAPAPLAVSPAHQGWIAITNAGAWLNDLCAAGDALAAATQREVVSMVILGNCYRLRLVWHRGQEHEVLHKTPKTGWLDQADETATMPLYEDVEALAFTTLTRLEIPAPLIALGTAPLECRPSTTTASENQGEGEGEGEAGARPEPAAEALVLGEGHQLAMEGETVVASTAMMCAPRVEGGKPPVIPAEMSADFGLMLFESRYLEGRPNRAALERLLEIEEALYQRARRARPDADELSLTVTYFAGVHQDAVDDYLRRRGRPTAAHANRGDHRIPWWQFWRYFGRIR